MLAVFHPERQVLHSVMPGNGKRETLTPTFSSTHANLLEDTYATVERT